MSNTDLESKEPGRYTCYTVVKEKTCLKKNDWFFTLCFCLFRLSAIIFYLYCCSLTKTSRGKKHTQKKQHSLNVFIDILFSKLLQCMLATATKSYIL